MLEFDVWKTLPFPYFTVPAPPYENIFWTCIPPRANQGVG